MKQLVRGFGTFSLTASLLLLAACGTTSGNANNVNMANVSEANRVDGILERAARDAKAAGNTTETLALLEQLHQRNEKDAAIATSFAQALREDDQLNRARQVIVPYTEGKKAYPDAVIELAMIQLALGQYKESELTSRQAVELAPEQGRGYLALGTALDAQNYHEQAEVAFRRGLDKWKGDPAPILNNLALNLASQNKLDQALEMLRKAQEISPNRVELERNRRIIATLKEGADDFNQPKAKVEKPAPVKTEAPKEEPKKKEDPKPAVKKDKPAPAKKPAEEAKPKKNFGEE